jgi:hypothetical protein
MWNDRTLEADIEYAAEMVREGLATTQQAAHACGIPISTLQAHLDGATAAADPRTADTTHALTGSSSADPEQRDAASESPHHPTRQVTTAADAQQTTPIVETTDYFVFFREHNRWVWKRVDASGNIVKTCEGGFPFYLDCVADARPHGFGGRPLFIFAASDIAALNASDKTL